MQVTIYIRKENEANWALIKDKSAWVNQQLEDGTPRTGLSSQVPSGVRDLSQAEKQAKFNALKEQLSAKPAADKYPDTVIVPNEDVA